jgi:hypothetical protein
MLAASNLKSKRMNSETITSAVPPPINDSRGISSEVGAIMWQGENGAITENSEQKPPTPNNLLKRTGTLKVGEASKVLFRSDALRKEKPARLTGR